MNFFPQIQILICMAACMIACGDDSSDDTAKETPNPDPASESIFATGQCISYSGKRSEVIWIDGMVKALDDPGSNIDEVFPGGSVLDGEGHIITVGTATLKASDSTPTVPVWWQNETFKGRLQTLGGITATRAENIVTDGSGGFVIVGYGAATPNGPKTGVYWTSLTSAPITLATKSFTPKSTFFSVGEVAMHKTKPHFAGAGVDEGSAIKDQRPIYWNADGDDKLFRDVPGDDNVFPHGMAITESGAVVLSVGRSYLIEDGEVVNLSTSSDADIARTAHVRTQQDDIFAAGYVERGSSAHAGYWKNSVWTELPSPSDSDQCSASDIAFKDSKPVILGECFKASTRKWVAGYWIDEMFAALPLLYADGDCRTYGRSHLLLE